MLISAGFTMMMMMMTMTMMMMMMMMMINCSEICTNRPSLSFVDNETRRNKVVVPEGAAGLIINQIISIT